MLSLPALKEDGKQLNTIKNANNERASSGNHQVYDYFSIKISRTTIEMLFNNEKDERYLYFLRYGFLRRYEGKGDILYVEIPQIPKNIVIYRKPSIRNKNSEKLYLNKKDLPHIPLLEGEENLKLLSLETNLSTVRNILKNTDGYIIGCQFGAFMSMQKYLTKVYNLLRFDDTARVRAREAL